MARLADDAFLRSPGFLRRTRTESLCIWRDSVSEFNIIVVIAESRPRDEAKGGGVKSDKKGNGELLLVISTIDLRIRGAECDDNWHSIGDLS